MHTHLEQLSPLAVESGGISWLWVYYALRLLPTHHRYMSTVSALRALLGTHYTLNRVQPAESYSCTPFRR